MYSRFFHVRAGIFALLAVVLLFSCARAGEPPSLTLESVSADTVWQRITVESDFRKYDYWPGHEGVQPGNSPHGKLHRVYINKTLRDALPIATNIAPSGSIIVKENLSGDRQLLGISVMAKIEGYDSANGDWFWAIYQPDGKEIMSGKIPMCVSCHAASYNDYIIIKRLDEALPGGGN